jgi:hypothetical protein
MQVMKQASLPQLHIGKPQVSILYPARLQKLPGQSTGATTGLLLAQINIKSLKADTGLYQKQG